MIVFFARIILSVQLIVMAIDWCLESFYIETIVYLAVMTLVLFVLAKMESKKQE